MDPAEVRKAERLTVAEIMERLPVAPHAVLSGGDPALHELGPLVDSLQAQGMSVSVETQGSRWREWLCKVEMLVISPKPPSSGMVTPEHDEETRLFMERACELSRTRVALKIVVFTQEDLDWARGFFECYPDFDAYLSVGTPVIPKGETDDAAIKAQVLDRFRWLCEQVVGDPDFARVRVLPQLHLLAWGTRRGV